MKTKPINRILLLGAYIITVTLSHLVVFPRAVELFPVDTVIVPGALISFVGIACLTWIVLRSVFIDPLEFTFLVVILPLGVLLVAPMIVSTDGPNDGTPLVLLVPVFYWLSFLAGLGIHVLDEHRGHPDQTDGLQNFKAKAPDFSRGR